MFGLFFSIFIIKYLIMNVPIYDGCPIWNEESVPFGFYNGDTIFQSDAVKVAKFCASRLGYPLVDIELQSSSFFTAFEEAVTTYGNEIYAYKIRDNQLSLEGLTTGSSLNQALITPSFEPIVRLTEQYGEEAGSGGNVPYYSGSFTLTSSIQDYDFNTFMTSSGYTGSEFTHGIEVKRVFYENPMPASARYLDPYGGFGFGGAVAAGMIGFGGFGMGMGYLMAPLNYDLQIIQQVEMNEMVRMSNYSFELKDTKLRIFPIPNFSGEIYSGSSLVIGQTLTKTATVPTVTFAVNVTSSLIDLPTVTRGGVAVTITQPAKGVILGDAGINNTYKFKVMESGSGYVSGDIITVSQAQIDGSSVSISNSTAALKLTLTDSNITSICAGGKIWFEYILRDDRINSSVKQTPANVTNVSNTPYNNPTYEYINSVGRQWIFEYTLALSKEMLGYVRGKYSSIPIPNSEVNLNQGDLISAATAEKSQLIERLRTYLDETSRQSLLNRRASEAESKMVELQQVPYTIFIA